MKTCDFALGKIIWATSVETVKLRKRAAMAWPMCQFLRRIKAMGCAMVKQIDAARSVSGAFFRATKMAAKMIRKIGMMINCSGLSVAEIAVMMSVIVIADLMLSDSICVVLY